MKSYPIDKYRFYDAGNKIIAVSTYAGKQVRGVAICHPDDKFDIETGKKIAAARCNFRISVMNALRQNMQKRRNSLFVLSGILIR